MLDKKIHDVFEGLKSVCWHDFDEEWDKLYKSVPWTEAIVVWIST